MKGNKMIERIQFLPDDFKESMQGMSYESIGRVFMALIAYAGDEDVEPILEGDAVAKAVYPIVKKQMLRWEDYRLSKVNNGKKGGGTLGNTNASKNNQEQPKTSENERKRPKTTENERKRPKTTENDRKRPTITNTITNTNTNNKRLYGECQNVRLTEDEHKKLVDKGYAGLIEELSLYIASKGDKYKSHYATVLQWARKREKVPASKNTFTRMTNRTDYDMDELEKLLVKN